MLRQEEKQGIAELYLNEKLSIYKIASRFNVTGQAIYYHLKKQNINLRGVSEALQLNNNKNNIQTNKRPKRGWTHSEETKQKMREKSLGRKNSEEARRKMSETRKNNPKYCGENHPLFGKERPDMIGPNHFNWNGGITPLSRALRMTPKYKQWRKECFERDHYICQMCNQRGGQLQVDHIKAYSRILFGNNITSIEQAHNCEELWDLNNGRTLCIECHRTTDTFGVGAKRKIG
jgi:predicted DNA-binding protein YlxM (UPF0122 family)